MFCFHKSMVNLRQARVGTSVETIHESCLWLGCRLGNLALNLEQIARQDFSLESSSTGSYHFRKVYPPLSTLGNILKTATRGTQIPIFFRKRTQNIAHGAQCLQNKKIYLKLPFKNYKIHHAGINSPRDMVV